MDKNKILKSRFGLECMHSNFKILLGSNEASKWRVTLQWNIFKLLFLKYPNSYSTSNKSLTINNLLSAEELFGI
jgi:hypothetical protein